MAIPGMVQINHLCFNFIFIIFSIGRKFFSSTIYKIPFFLFEENNFFLFVSDRCTMSGHVFVQ